MAWLLFNGHWGELHGGISGDGPTGPMRKDQWHEPFTWMEDQRRDQPRAPGDVDRRPGRHHAFCGAVADVSEFLNLKTRSNAAGWAILALILAGLVVAVRLTAGARRGRRAAHRRALGQLLAAAGALYAAASAPMVAIGLAALPLLVLLEAVDWLGQAGRRRRAIPPPPAPAAPAPLSDPFLAYARPVVFAVVAATVVAYVRELDQTRHQHMAAVRLMGARSGVCWPAISCAA